VIPFTERGMGLAARMPARLGGSANHIGNFLTRGNRQQITGLLRRLVGVRMQIGTKPAARQNSFASMPTRQLAWTPTCPRAFASSAI
jgi:hypothetical protein